MKPSSGCGKHACAYWKHWENRWEALEISRDDKKQLCWEHRDGPCAGSHWLPVARGASPMCNSSGMGWAWTAVPATLFPAFSGPYEQDLPHKDEGGKRGARRTLHLRDAPARVHQGRGKGSPRISMSFQKTGDLMWEGNLCSRM